jgi:hypothetical protein
LHRSRHEEKLPKKKEKQQHNTASIIKKYSQSINSFTQTTLENIGRSTEDNGTIWHGTNAKLGGFT